MWRPNAPCQLRHLPSALATSLHVSTGQDVLQENLDGNQSLDETMLDPTRRTCIRRSAERRLRRLVHPRCHGRRKPLMATTPSHSAAQSYSTTQRGLPECRADLHPQRNGHPFEPHLLARNQQHTTNDKNCGGNQRIAQRSLFN